MRLMVMEVDGMGNGMPGNIGEMRRRGDLVLLSSSREKSFVKRNYYRYCNGFLAFGGRCGFTCCAKIVDKPIEDLPGLRNRLAMTGASVWYHDLGKSYLPEQLTGKEKIRGIEVRWETAGQEERFLEIGEIRLIEDRHAMLRLRDVKEADSVREMASFLKVPLEDVHVFGWHDSLLDGFAHAYDLNEMPLGEAIGMAKAAR